MRSSVLSTALLLALFAGSAGAQTTVQISASKDNTLYEDTSGGLSNGMGESLVAGKPFFAAIRRAVIAFDVTSIPAGSTINSVALRLSVTREPPDAPPVTATLHTLLADWGEGASLDMGAGGAGALPEANDATWIHRFFDAQLWDTQGGDFQADPSASASIPPGALAAVFSTNPDIEADVHHWINDPSTNFGWIIRIQETLDGSARRFASRENTDPALRPVLEVTFTPPAACPADFNNDGSVDPDDLGDYINCYFSVPPCDRADFNSDGSTDPDDLGDFINIYFSSTSGC
ncbi:MAG: DNRLRE domain-containing protein [Phycisphaerales bacterium]